MIKMINLTPSRRNETRMEVLMSRIGEKRTSALWQEFLRRYQFSDIDMAWDKFEEWMHGVNEQVSKLVGKR